MCPICTVTVIAGLGISRLLGIDDLITSLWIGAFILSFSFVTVDWLKKRKWFASFNSSSVKQFISPTVIVLMYLLVLIPLKLNHSIGIALNRIWGIDKIILGTFIGSIIFLVGVWADKYQRRKFKKIFFPFQKVVFPVTGLVILSVIFYFVTRK
ncbi:MAG TPA: hypothetical protein VMR19_04380 [Candidatus Saccharimonadales bacterium]|jgi:uncharacterized membrane protein|nr:hypothetical protein [Candidatus Saccharimonadales bacterium]